MAKRSLLITPVDAPKDVVATYVNLEVESSNKYDTLRILAPDGSLLTTITVVDGAIKAEAGEWALPKEEESK